MDSNLLQEMKVMLETALTQLHQHMVACHDTPPASPVPPQATLPTKTTQTPSMPNTTVLDPSKLYAWDNPVTARHNVRVLCDRAGLSLADKNIVTAVIHAESGFDNNAKCLNHDKRGNLTSTDWCIIQCNDKYHIGPGKEFPSVDYVLQNPEKMVNWMIDMYKVGKITLWVGFTSGAYKKFLPV